MHGRRGWFVRSRAFRRRRAEGAQGCAPRGPASDALKRHGRVVGAENTNGPPPREGTSRGCRDRQEGDVACPTRIEAYIGRAEKTANSPTCQTDMRTSTSRPRQQELPCNRRARRASFPERSESAFALGMWKGGSCPVSGPKPGSARPWKPSGSDPSIEIPYPSAVASWAVCKRACGGR